MRAFASSRLTAATLALAALSLAGCARDVIPNTDVRDTVENREIIDFLEQYRKAVEKQDVQTLMKLASKRYLDDNGTPVGRDDLDYESLGEKLRRWDSAVDKVRYEIRYRRVSYHQDRVFVDVTYTASFRVDTPEGKRWARRLADNRMVLSRDRPSGKYRIVSGM
jgi:hypothetical protein